MKRILSLILVLLIAFSAFGCGQKNTEEEPEKEYRITDEALLTGSPTEGKNRVFYEIFVGSFSDSDGDGIGDLRGIINRMDYLNDGDPASGKSLGVEGLWLTPIFSSPSYHKYDVTDYYTVDPSFGTEEDLKELIDICHERDVWLILDLPINHTGKMNEWYGSFVKAHRNDDSGSDYYDLYSWYDGSFDRAPAGRTFAQISGTQHYYECNFSGDMPELNFDSDYARQLVLDVAKHYISLGVDGFRFDAAKYIYFNDNQMSSNFWIWYVNELKSYSRAMGKIDHEVYTVAEVWDSDNAVNPYLKATDCFNFTISKNEGLIAETAKKDDAGRYTRYVENFLKNGKSLRADAGFTPFITNHDMDRAAGFLTVASGAMQMAANVYILGPGTPFIYYGEELGMCGSRGASNTDANRRLAMLWGDDDTVEDPVGATYPATSQPKNGAAAQMLDPNSLFTYYKKLIMIRKANPEIALGSYSSVSFSGSKVGAFVSTYDGSSVLVIHNNSGQTQTVDFSTLAGYSFSALNAVIGTGGATLEGTVLTIEPMTSVVVR